MRGATGLWVRATLRDRRAVTVALAVLLGVSAGAVAMLFAAERRSQTSLVRFQAQSNDFDAIIGGCPPDVDPSAVQSQVDILKRCTNPTTMEQFRTDVIDPLPEVEDSALVGVGVVGIRKATTGRLWPHGVLVFYTMTPGGGLEGGGPLVVAGRLPQPNATDEVVLGERAARLGGFHVGDTLQIASWKQEELDTAVDRGSPPTLPPFTARLVGIVRYLIDVQTPGDPNVMLPDAMYAGSAWGAAHYGELAGYGTNVAVHLRRGQADLKAVQDEIDATGWHAGVGSAEDADLTALRRALRFEGRAVLVTGVIAAIAVAALLGLLLLTQLRRELSVRRELEALGMSPAGILCGAMLRMLAVLLPAVVVAVGVAIACSPLEPFGLARRIEFGHPFRADVLVLVVTIVALGALTAAAVAAAWHAAGTRTRVAGGAARVRPGVGPVTRTGASFIRGSSARLVAVVTAVAVAALVMSAGLVASLDRVLSHPQQYGAWWHVAVGQYSEPDALRAGVAKLRADPDVSAAAGVYDGDPEETSLDGEPIAVLGYEPYIGAPRPVLMAGSEPRTDTEVALGAATARRLHKRIGDSVLLGPTGGQEPGREMTVTGIAVLDDPVNSERNAGDGVFVTSAVAAAITTSIPQSIVVQFRHDIAENPVALRAALDRIAVDFGNSMRTPSPQADLVSLQRLRFVPIVLAALIAGLGAAVMLHGVATIARRRRRDVAVLGAMGMTRRQRLGTIAVVGTWIAAVASAIGLVAGALAGRAVWARLRTDISIPASWSATWVWCGFVAVATVVVAAVAAGSASAWQTRRGAAAALRTE